MRRRAIYLIAVLFFLAYSPVFAQTTKLTTPGQLLEGRVDTLEVHLRSGSELGSRSSHLLAARRDSGFVGTLRFEIFRDDQLSIVGHTPRPQRCDTTIAAFIPLFEADRIVTLVGTTRIAIGPAPPVRPTGTDVFVDRWFRLAGQGGALNVTDMSAIRHNDVDYHVPPSVEWKKMSAFVRSFTVDNTSLVAAASALDAHLRHDQESAFERKCLKID